MALSESVPKTSKPRVLFITSCCEAWGGSEELWGAAALELRARGAEVFTGRLYPYTPVDAHPKWARLKAAGVGIENFRIPEWTKTLPAFMWSKFRHLAGPFFSLRHRFLCRLLARLRVDLVVISQGVSYDGINNIELPLICQTLKIPYVLICHKASEVDWPIDETARRLRGFFEGASANFFVSEHNRRHVSTQLGMVIPRSRIVRNPFMVDYGVSLPWPASPHGLLNLAFVGRMWPSEKGQDILLNTLALEKWRKRPLMVDLYGDGPCMESLQKLAAMHQLRNVRFCGTVHDIEGIWLSHHALVLPSRAEGLPLVLVEAMLCGRVPIVTNAGGNAEVIEPGVNGFVAAAPTVELFDRALEEAWQQRERWQEMGRLAAAHIRTIIPENPAAIFVEELLSLIAKSETKSPSLLLS